MTVKMSSLLLPIAAICIILLHMELQQQSLSFPHQLLFKKVILKTIDDIYYFRAKNTWHYQNGWPAQAPPQLLFKKFDLVSLCVLGIISEGFFQCVEWIWLTLSKWLDSFLAADVHVRCPCKLFIMIWYQWDYQNGWVAPALH